MADGVTVTFDEEDFAQRLQLRRARFRGLLHLQPSPLSVGANVELARDRSHRPRPFDASQFL